MHKLLLAIFLLVILAAPKSEVLAVDAPSCADKGVYITFNTEDQNDLNTLPIATNTPFQVNVKIPKKTANPDWYYYPALYIEGDIIDTSGAGRASSKEYIKGDKPTSSDDTYNIYTFNMPGISRQWFRSQNETFYIGVNHSESAAGTLLGQGFCRGNKGQIQTGIGPLLNAGDCPITMPGNFQYVSGNTKITGKTTLKNIPGVTYYYRLHSNDVHTKIPTNARQPVGVDSGILFQSQDRFSDDYGMVLNPGTEIDLPPLDSISRNEPALPFAPGTTYTAAIYAVANDGLNPVTYACGYKVFSITNDPTSEPTKGEMASQTTLNSGSEISCRKDDEDCTTSEPIPCSSEGIMTAIGCVPTEPKALVEGLLKYGTLAAGGVAFLVMIFAALQMITAEGNPESIKTAQEKFYSAIIGLLLIIFSVLLMQVIGVDILGLKGFGK